MLEDFFVNSKKFLALMMKYRSAVREIKTKLEVLDDEFSIEHRRNPIESIQSRIKSPESIYQKLKKLGYEVTEENIRQYLNDVAGIRVVCPFLEDIYHVATLLASQDDITVIKVKDYIKNPKENGYRSYHMIVEIPVFFSEGKTPMRAEVQIRTMGMDFWASLEHQIRYKKGLEGTELYDKMSQRLQESAKMITATDIEMQEIKRMLEKFQEEQEKNEKCEWRE
ncbi:MAG: GTP pyrophosphokinase family protein [Lachnospiraceae bacterium]